jgi:hypothetical protein
MNTSTAIKCRKVFTILVVGVFIFTISGNLWSNAYAKDIPTETPAPGKVLTETPYIEVINPHFSIEHTTLADGTPVLGYMINGPSKPPAGYNAGLNASIKPAATAVILPNFPSFSWVFGCSAVSGAMIATYYDRGAYTNIYTGTTNGGVMPLTDTSWPTWSDGTDTYPNNPLIASHNGVDGRTIRGSIDDYWVSYGSTANDPYITGGWAQHTWGTAIGDYMKTSQSAYGSVDGNTWFYNYNSNAKLTCSDMVGGGVANKDGTYGRKLFYEARGYTVTDCYNQNTDNMYSGGFSLANFQAEINAGNPVLLNLYGHSIVGYGYDGTTVYLRNTWESDPGLTFTMTWGTSYETMQLRSVSIVHLTPPTLAKHSFMPLIQKPSPPNQNPTDILLSNSTIEENKPINTVVGTLTSTDPNVGDTFTYSLVSGAGDTGNASFNILTNQLRSSAVFNYALQNSYSIRLRTTDQGGLYFEKAFTITITQVVANPIINGDFEQGPGVGWTEFTTDGIERIRQTFPGTVTPHGGTWATWLGGNYNVTTYIQQQVTVPAGQHFLSYWHWIASLDSCGYDVGGVLVNGTAVDAYWLCSDNDTNGWVQRVIDLSVYAGTSVTLQIKAVNDVSLNSNLFIDDVTFQASSKASNPVHVDTIDINASTLIQDVPIK